MIWAHRFWQQCKPNLWLQHLRSHTAVHRCCAAYWIDRHTCRCICLIMEILDTGQSNLPSIEPWRLRHQGFGEKFNSIIPIVLPQLPYSLPIHYHIHYQSVTTTTGCFLFGKLRSRIFGGLADSLASQTGMPCLRKMPVTFPIQHKALLRWRRSQASGP